MNKTFCDKCQKEGAKPFIFIKQTNGIALPPQWRGDLCSSCKKKAVKYLTEKLKCES